MFKLKLWAVVVLFLAGSAAVLVTGTPLVADAVFKPVERELRSQRAAAEGVLRARAQAGVDAVAMRAVNPDVVAFVKAADKEADGTTVEATLRSVNDGEAATATSFAVLADKTGKVLFQSGAKALGESVASWPVVVDAQRGFVRDGLQRGGKDIHMLAASPIYAADEVIGVVVLGWKVDAEMLDDMSAKLSVPSVLVAGSERIGAQLPGIPVSALPPQNGERYFGTPELALPVPLPLPLMVEHNERFLGARVPYFVGTKDLGFVVAVDRTGALRAVALVQLGLMGFMLLMGMLLVVMMMTISRSVSKPLSIITEHLGKVQQGTSAGILPTGGLRGPFERVGKQINMLLERAPASSNAGFASGVTRSPIQAPKTDGMQIQPGPQAAPAPEAPSSAALVAEALAQVRRSGEGDPVSAPAPVAPTPPQAPSPGLGLPGAPVGAVPPLAPVTPEAPAPSALSGGLGFGDMAAADESAANELSALFGDAPAAAPAPAPAPPAPAAPEGDGNFNPEATMMFQVPKELLDQAAGPVAPTAPQAPAFQPAAAPAAAPAPERNEATVIAQIPPELLSQASQVDAPAVGGEDEAHFREVFEQFVRTRQECGEDTRDLTYSRFVQKLIKNRRPIMDKYQCSSVRFQVYVKQGKAALRAVPVRG